MKREHHHCDIGLTIAHTCTLGRHYQTCDGVDETKDKMRRGEPSNIYHNTTKSWLDHTIAHADDE